jgi:hypothetical protein
MRIEIYIVKTEIEKLSKNLQYELNTILEAKKKELIEMFTGLTEIPNCKGFWLDKDKLEIDKVSIWLIYTNKSIEPEVNPEFYDILTKLRLLTKQKVLAYTIDNNILFWKD